MDDSWAWTEHQIPPYISSFDQSLPGIYFLYYFIFKLLGASIFSIRLFDYFFQLINLSLIFYLTQKISPPEWRPLDGLIAVLLYSTFYLSLGPTCTVLKDGFVLTPMLISGSLYLKLFFPT